jgi:AbrB family looped-hinge helix DNA binding protein
MATATLTSKGQITIPVRVRAALRLEPGDRVEFVESETGEFTMIPANRSVRELDGMFKGRRKKPLSIKEMNAAIARRAADLFK